MTDSLKSAPPRASGKEPSGHNYKMMFEVTEEKLNEYIDKTVAAERALADARTKLASEDRDHKATLARHLAAETELAAVKADLASVRAELGEAKARIEMLDDQTDGEHEMNEMQIRENQRLKNELDALRSQAPANVAEAVRLVSRIHAQFKSSFTSGEDIPQHYGPVVVAECEQILLALQPAPPEPVKPSAVERKVAILLEVLPRWVKSKRELQARDGANVPWKTSVEKELFDDVAAYESAVAEAAKGDPGEITHIDRSVLLQATPLVIPPAAAGKCERCGHVEHGGRDCGARIVTAGIAQFVCECQGTGSKATSAGSVRSVDSATREDAASSPSGDGVFGSTQQAGPAGVQANHPCKRCGKPVQHPAQEYCGAACSAQRGRAVAAEDHGQPGERMTQDPPHTCTLASGAQQPAMGCPGCNAWAARDPVGFANRFRSPAPDVERLLREAQERQADVRLNATHRWGTDLAEALSLVIQAVRAMGAK